MAEKNFKQKRELTIAKPRHEIPGENGEGVWNGVVKFNKNNHLWKL